MPKTGSVTCREFRQQLEKISPGQRDALYDLQHNPELLRPRLEAQTRNHAVAVGKFRKSKAGLEQFVESQIKAKTM